MSDAQWGVVLGSVHGRPGDVRVGGVVWGVDQPLPPLPVQTDCPPPPWSGLTRASWG